MEDILQQAEAVDRAKSDEIISAQPLNGHTPLNGEKEEGEVDEQDDPVLYGQANCDIDEDPEVCFGNLSYRLQAVYS